MICIINFYFTLINLFINIIVISLKIASTSYWNAFFTFSNMVLDQLSISYYDLTPLRMGICIIEIMQSHQEINNILSSIAGYLQYYES